MASSYLTYKEPSYSDLIGGTPTNLLPKWLFNREYTPLPDVMAEAEKMGQIDAQRQQRNRLEQAQGSAEEIFAPSEDGTKKPLEEGLSQLEEKLYELGMVDPALKLTDKRQDQEYRLKQIERQALEERRKAETPRYVKFGDAIFKEYPDGRLEMDRPVPKSPKPDKEKKPLRASEVFEDMMAQKMIDAELKKQASQAAQPGGPGILDEAGAWLSGMLNQPTVNPRARATPVPLDTGASISGNPQRRVITVRRKAIEQ